MLVFLEFLYGKGSNLAFSESGDDSGHHKSCNAKIFHTMSDQCLCFPFIRGRFGLWIKTCDLSGKVAQPVNCAGVVRSDAAGFQLFSGLLV